MFHQLNIELAVIELNIDLYRKQQAGDKNNIRSKTSEVATDSYAGDQSQISETSLPFSRNRSRSSTLQYKEYIMEKER